MSAPSYRAVFQSEGRPTAASGDRPVLLRTGKVWIVRSGRVDLFAAALSGGGPAGARTHLFRVEAGAPLFGITSPTDDGTAMQLIAVGSSGTVLEELDLEYVQALAGYPDFRAPVAALLHAWIGQVYDGLVGGRRLQRFLSVSEGEEVEVEGGTCVRPEAQVGWIRQEEGSARLLGRAGVEIGPGESVPVSRRGWVESAGAARVRVTGTEQLLEGADPGVAWEGLERLHGFLVAITAERLREAEAAHRLRQRSRVQQGESVMRSALTQLAAVMEPARPRSGMRLRASADGVEEDTLLAAFRLVAQAQGIPIDHALLARRAERKNPVDALAQAARVRVRRVVLRDRWWEADAGPLLARLSEGSEPVALLPVPKGGYDLHDPAARSCRRVDGAVAATLEPFAFTLYRPFPAGALSLREVLRFGFHGCRRDLLAAAGAGTAMALLGLVTPFAVGVLFDVVIPGAERGQLLQLTLLLVVCALAATAFHVVRAVALLRIETRVGNAIQAAVWDRLLALPLPFFRGYSAGDLAVRAMGIDEIRRTLSGTVVTALLGGIFSLANFVLLFHYDAGLAGLATVLIGAALAASVAVSCLQLRAQRLILQMRARTSGMVLQILSGIGKLKVVGAEVQAFGVWARLFAEQRQRRLRVRTLANRLTVFNAVLPVLCSIVLFAMALSGDGGKPMNTGDFVAFVTAFNLCLTATLTATGAVINSLTVVPLYEQVEPILHTPPEARAGKHFPGELSGSIELQHLSFRYQADGPVVLHDVSVRIRAGEFVAFVGPSGSGKSTIFRLLLGFETAESGSIYYDEQELSGLDIQAVRRQVGVVLQNGKLMAGDIYSNIVGSSLATADDAWEAARMAGLEDDLRQMPMGLFTVVHEGGTTLSGGQRQRLLIARAIVNRPRILLFDEATSALDNRTQDIVSRSLARLQTTRVVIAHRLSTIVGADRIYVVQAGSIVESGNYEELLARNGVFAEMARRQLI